MNRHWLFVAGVTAVGTPVIPHHIFTHPSIYFRPCVFLIDIIILHYSGQMIWNADRKLHLFPLDVQCLIYHATLPFPLFLPSPSLPVFQSRAVFFGTEIIHVIQARDSEEEKNDQGQLY